MHRSDYQFSIYSNAHTYNPTSGLLCAIVQDRVYRFKQIWAFINVRDFGTSGKLQAYLRFWQGAYPFSSSIPAINTVQSAMLNNFPALEVAKIPAGIVTSTTGTGTLSWGTNTTAHWTQTFANCFTYSIARSTAFITVPQTLDMEIICDFMTLDIAWSGNQYAPNPAMLACIGSTHPVKQYEEYNFASL